MKGERKRVKINRKSKQKVGARPRAILAVALMSVCREARRSAVLSPSEGWPRKWEGQEEGSGVERGRSREWLFMLLWFWWDILVDEPEQQLKIWLLKFRREAGTSTKTITGTVKISVGTHSEPWGWCEDYFKLKALEMQQMQKKAFLACPLSD